VLSVFIRGLTWLQLWSEICDHIWGDQACLPRDKTGRQVLWLFVCFHSLLQLGHSCSLQQQLLADLCASLYSNYIIYISPNNHLHISSWWSIHFQFSLNLQNYIPNAILWNKIKTRTKQKVSLFQFILIRKIFNNINIIKVMLRLILIHLFFWKILSSGVQSAYTLTKSGGNMLPPSPH
jgi:hypothetical protein